MNERRSHARLEEKLHINVMLLPEQRLPEDELLSLSHETTDVSSTGLRFLTHRPLQVNAFMRVDIVLPGSTDTLSLSAVVRWIEYFSKENTYCIGVEFFHLPGDPDMQQWTDYIARQLRGAYEEGDQTG